MSDFWSDPNLMPYMAVTMHWIYADRKKTTCGTQYELKLRADLIGFFRVPHRHTGQHLGAVFLHVLKQIKIKKVCNTSCTNCGNLKKLQIGWITVDNASNNDTMMQYIQDQLIATGISFDQTQNRIRQDNIYYLIYYLLISLLFNFFRCFPHIVNLTVQSCLTSITDITLISDSAMDHNSNSSDQHNSRKCDPIAKLQDAIHAVCILIIII